MTGSMRFPLVSNGKRWNEHGNLSGKNSTLRLPHLVRPVAMAPTGLIEALSWVR